MNKFSHIVSHAIAVAAIAVCSVIHAANWVYENGTISDGYWKFNASVEKNTTNLTVGQPVEADCPASITPLDFSKPVVKASDESVTYTITTLNTGFTRWAKIDGTSANYTYDCAKYVGAFTLPGEGLIKIGNKAFHACVNLTADLVFPTTLTTIEVGAFYGTRVTSAWFPPASSAIDGGYDTGLFQNCKQLTNVVFAAGGSYSFTSGFVFQGCTALKELDLSGVASFSLSANRDQGNYTHFNGCTSLTNIIFGSGVAFNTTNVINNCPALKTLRFHGLPPSVIKYPWLAGVPASQTIATIIDVDQVDAWSTYAECGEINAEDSTWAAAYVANGIDLSKRPLLHYIDPNAKRPRISSIETSDVWTNKVTVTVSGSDLLGGTITITLDDGENAPVVRQMNDYGSLVISPLVPATRYSVSARAVNDNGSDNKIYDGDVSTYGVTNLAARAVWTDNMTKLTFYYDDVDRTSLGPVCDFGPNGSRTWGTPSGGDWVNDDTTTLIVFDSSFKAYKPKTCAQWFSRFRVANKDFVTIEGIENLDTSEVTSMYRMFYNFRSAGNVDMSHFETKKVTTFEQMFGYSGWNTMDLSSFSTKSATSMRQMFIGAGSVQTIYVSERFDMSRVTNSSDMFSNCKKPLVGGAGTTWTSDNPTDKTYARIDGGVAAPGYFTFKPCRSNRFVILFY